MSRNALFFGLLVVAAGVGILLWQRDTRAPSTMTLDEAVSLARQPASACSREGVVAGTGTYNENSQTWWLDFSPREPRAGCNPACVVSAATGASEINWRCTGALPPIGSFMQEGNVTRDNPGQKPGRWYLVYEEPGAPARALELDLNSVAAPYIDLEKGERVVVEGQRIGDVVIVSAIRPASVTPLR